jgi:hypothetical protein
MKKIIEQAAEWEMLRQLPAEYAGFILEIELAECGSQYALFTYRKPGEYRSFSVLYDKATKDYLARVTVGLTEFYDVSFITTSLSSLETVLSGRLRHTLEDLANPAAREYESIFRAKKILEWPYAADLPVELAGFILFISPQQTVKTINGSYVIIDYSDFSAASNLSIYYNIYRDEFFGEIRLRQTPRMISLFDAKELPDLAEKLKANLSPALESLRKEIG